ncbi:MAG: hypothetical protein JNN28_11590 [Saprospiraceae bacterium]|nr:hypothetical protein [Saprospiraceae bacterium]
MDDSNLPNSQYAFLWKFFSLDTPVGKLLFVVLVLLGLAFYIKFFGWPFGKEKDCSGRVTLVGVLLNEKNRTPLEGVTAHFATFSKDETDSHGLFSVEGIEMPESKIITLRVEFQGGKHLEVEGIDLRNNVKYPVKDCKIDLGQILVSPENANQEPNHKSGTGTSRNVIESNNDSGLKDAQPLPTNTLFNEGTPANIAILAAGKLDGYPVANLKNSMAERWNAEGLTTTNSLLQPGFYSRYAINLEGDDIATVKSSGIGNHTACLCFLKIDNIKTDRETIETGGEEHGFEKASGSLDVKFFAFRTGKVTSFTISETGAGGNRARAMESLNDKFITQFFNHKLALNACKN